MSDSRTNPTSASALRQFDDYIEDVVSAPDICAANLVTNDNVAITMAVHIHDRDAFAALDTYRIHLDTDSNPATGAPAEAGPLAGADFVIDLVDDASVLSTWTGSSFVPVAPQPQIPTGWIEGYGPVLQIARSALGNPTTFNLVVDTGNGGDLDLAPDSGSWPYVVTPLQLTAGRLALSPARAGRSFAAAMKVTRSDFEIPLDEGSITCRGSVAGKKLTGRGRFTDELVACSWRIPKSARGKRVLGSVSVNFQGVSATRSYAVRVR